MPLAATERGALRRMAAAPASKVRPGDSDHHMMAAGARARAAAESQWARLPLAPPPAGPGRPRAGAPGAAVLRGPQPSHSGGGLGLQ